MAAGLSPACAPSIIGHPKVGFPIPLSLWLRGPLRDWAVDLTSDKRLAKDGLFSADIVRKTWPKHHPRSRDWPVPLTIKSLFRAWFTGQVEI
ncbi:asparagine synthase-related protein [Sulfitobacter sp. OXR-159]|uniref:asparagine synthase-related protein n=1 Tax=Sulfitobacter sp. OXR-159 TaxID=3100174 RepID=UPI0039FCE4DD